MKPPERFALCAVVDADGFVWLTGDVGSSTLESLRRKTIFPLGTLLIGAANEMFYLFGSWEFDGRCEQFSTLDAAIAAGIILNS